MYKRQCVGCVWRLIFKKFKNFDIVLLDLNNSHDGADTVLSFYLYSLAHQNNCTILLYHDEQELSFDCDTTQDLFGDYRDDEEFEDCLEFDEEDEDEQLELALG